MGSTLNAYLNKFEEFKALPAGQSFTIRVMPRTRQVSASAYKSARASS